MKSMTSLIEPIDGAVLADGFEDALVGFGHQFTYPIAVYSKDKCIDILMTRDKMTDEEAIEYFEFNVSGAWMGVNTPVFLQGDY